MYDTNIMIAILGQLNIATIHPVDMMNLMTQINGLGGHAVVSYQQHTS